MKNWSYMDPAQHLGSIFHPCRHPFHWPQQVPAWHSYILTPTCHARYECSPMVWVSPSHHSVNHKPASTLVWIDSSGETWRNQPGGLPLDKVAPLDSTQPEDPNGDWQLFGSLPMGNLTRVSTTEATSGCSLWAYTTVYIRMYVFTMETYHSWDSNQIQSILD